MRRGSYIAERWEREASQLLREGEADRLESNASASSAPNED